jgi:transcription initiation factor IIF auxiliary subunit
MKKYQFFSIIFLLLFYVYSGAQTTRKVVQANIKSKAHYVEKGRYDWKIYINADVSVLRTISYVEYKLNPTYPVPVNKRTNYKNKFLYENKGWGEFYITVTVVYNNKSKSVFKYLLKLKNDENYSSLD